MRKMYIFANRYTKIITNHHMKKIFTLIAVAALALSASADRRAQLRQGMLRSGIPTVESLDRPAKAEPEHNWTPMGDGVMVDDITPAYFDWKDVVIKEITVAVEKDAANEGWYRIVNPWKNYDQMDLVTAAGGTLEQTDDITIVIDATNPDYARVMETNIGVDDGYGPSNIVGYTELVGVNTGIGVVTQAAADARAGKLADGVISFPVKYSLMLHQGDDYYNCDSDGRFSLSLPGTEAPIDYSLQIAMGSKFCPGDEGKYHFTFKGDSRIPGVKYIGASEYPETQAAIDACVEKLRTEGTVVPVDTEASISIADATGPEYFMFYCAVDADGNLAEELPYYVAVWVPDTDTEGWTTLGMATMTEGFLSCTLPDNFAVETYQVEVQRNIADPGLFRIVNPYNPWSHASQFMVQHDHNHYIYFNAADHGNVYIMESGLGLSMANLGETGIGSSYYDMVRQYGLDFLNMFEIYSGGTITDNVLTFDGTVDIRLYFGGLGKWVYTDRFPNPDYVEGVSDYWDEYVGGNFKLDMTGLDLSGIADIAADDADAPAVYYNMQGMRVSHPEAGGCYIVRRGGKASKVMIR